MSVGGVGCGMRWFVVCGIRLGIGLGSWMGSGKVGAGWGGDGGGVVWRRFSGEVKGERGGDGRGRGREGEGDGREG